MMQPNNQAFIPLRIAAERILSTALGDRIEIDKIESLTEPGRRNLLLRCFINRVEDTPSSFILKKVESQNYDPDDAESRNTRRLFNDWIGSQFLNTIPSKHQHSPIFYGGDRTLGFIVIEDVQHRHSLVEPLLGNDRQIAERALLQYAACLGRLHRDTLGRVAEFQELYKTVSLKMKPAKFGVKILQHQLSLEKLGIVPEPEWLSDLQAIHQTVSSPGEFLAYIHTDACPDNVLDTGQELRLIDFETSFFGHSFMDAVFGRMMFPSCWCSQRLPIEIVRQMENTYRAMLIQRCSILEDDEVFETALVHNCGWWLLCTISDFLADALVADGDFGISTFRQRILARLEAFITISQECDRLNGLCGTSERLLDLLHQRWSDVPELPVYPTFQ